jgi:hypothetical protein
MDHQIKVLSVETRILDETNDKLLEVYCVHCDTEEKIKIIL